MKNNKILLIIIIILLIVVLIYFFLNNSNQKIKESSDLTKNLPQENQRSTTNTPTRTSTWGGSDKFVFLQDYEVKQDTYNDGEFPSGVKTTVFKKGDIIEGKYGIVSCQGDGCIPPEVVRVVINGQNWAINKTILVPYKK